MNYIKYIFNKLFRLIYLFFLRIDILFLKKNNETIVYDIDNTLANTWPTIQTKTKASFSNERNRLSSLKLVPHAKDLVNYSKSNFGQIIFLTARNPKYYFITKKWLKKKFGDMKFKLILVPNVNLKINYWNKLHKLSNRLVVLDDLSYNHENNLIKFYNNEINFLKSKKNIEYFDYDHIKKGLDYIKRKL